VTQRRDRAAAARGVARGRRRRPHRPIVRDRAAGDGPAHQPRRREPRAAHRHVAPATVAAAVLRATAAAARTDARRAMTRPRLCPIGAALLLGGCAAVRAGQTVRTYRLSYPPPKPLPPPPLPVTVRVMPFGVAVAYQSEAFVYRTARYDIGVDP